MAELIDSLLARATSICLRQMLVYKCYKSHLCNSISLPACKIMEDMFPKKHTIPSKNELVYDCSSLWEL